MTHQEKAEALFAEGYNCAQSVVLAFAQELKLDEATLARISSSFGGGVGKMREVCGAISGIAMVVGLLDGYSDPKSVSEKAELYALIQKLSGEFAAINHSIICRDLLADVEHTAISCAPEARTTEYYAKRPCKELVGSAAKILQEYYHL